MSQPSEETAYVPEDMSATEASENMRSKAYQLCRDYLLGAWKTIGEKNMVLKQISGGLSNHLFYCALPPNTDVINREPKEVLLRVYGQMHGEDALENMLAESVIFTLLSERKLGPFLYGVFPGGRIEQYINARSLFREELADKDISQQIARKIARVHALNVPISKEASWLWTSINKWLTSTEELLRNSTKDETLIKCLKSFDVRGEVAYVRNLVNQLQSPVVFAHNDLQEGNILLQKTKNGRKVSLIDFEYCAYNYRSFDIANHFGERVYGYRMNSAPFYSVHPEEYPTVEQQLLFIRTYLTEYNSNKVEGSSDENITMDCSKMSPRLQKWMSEALTEEQVILKEVKVFSLAGHLFWLLWSIVQGHVSTIEFGYLEYAKTRMDHYIEQKNALESLMEQSSRCCP